MRKSSIRESTHVIILAVNSAFRKLKNLYSKIVPVFESYYIVVNYRSSHIEVICQSEARQTRDR